MPTREDTLPRSVEAIGYEMEAFPGGAGAVPLARPPILMEAEEIPREDGAVPVKVEMVPSKVGMSVGTRHDPNGGGSLSRTRGGGPIARRCESIGRCDGALGPGFDHQTPGFDPLGRLE